MGMQRHEIIQSWQALDGDAIESYLRGNEDALPQLKDLMHQVIFYRTENEADHHALFDAVLCSQEVKHHSNSVSLDVVLDGLKKKGKQKKCGYVFQENDIAFNCYTCQVDDTCVLCQSCFENGIHQAEGHQFRFHRTQPGGLCDCGDIEAYAPEGFCIHHGPSSSEEEEKAEDSIARLSPRIRQVGTLMLDQFFRVMSERAFGCGLDSIHDLDLSVYHLRICVNHRIMDRQGRGNLETITNFYGCDWTTDETYISTPCRVISRPTDLESSNEAVKELVMALQDKGWFVNLVSEDTARLVWPGSNFLNWLKRVVEEREEGLCQLIAQVLFGGHFESFLTRDAHLMKPLMHRYHEFLRSLMSNDLVKWTFSLQYWKHYQDSIQKLMSGEGVEEYGILVFGVQIFTTSSIVQQLVSDHECLEVCLGIFEYIMSQLSAVEYQGKSLRPEHSDLPQRSYVLLHPIFQYLRYTTFIRDFEYVLKSKNVASVFLSKPYLVARFSKSLAQLQGLHPLQRRHESQPHIEYVDKLWEIVLQLQYIVSNHLFSSIWHGFNHVSCEDTTFMQASRALHESIMSFITNEPTFIWQPINSGDEFSEFFRFQHSPHPIMCQYDVATQPISFYYGFNIYCVRYFEHIFEVLDDAGTDIDISGVLSNSVFAPAMDTTKLILGLIEFPIRLCVLNAQIGANLWIRNGPSMAYQSERYYGLMTFDRDLLLLQMGLVHLQPNQFLGIYFQRFQLLDYFFSISLDQMHPAQAEREKVVKVAEECLQMLIWIVTELPHYSASASSSSLRMMLRQEMIHQLAVKPRFYSELASYTQSLLASQVKHHSPDSYSLDSILSEITSPKEAASANEPAKYELKENCFIEEYNPCYYHLNRTEHELAQDRCNELRSRQQKRDLGEFLPAVGCPHPVHPYFAQVRLALLDVSIFQLIRKVLFHHLENFAPQKDAANRMIEDQYQSSEVLLSQVIHLLTLQVHTVESLENIDDDGARNFEVYTSMMYAELNHCPISTLPMEMDHDRPNNKSISQNLCSLSNILSNTSQLYHSIMWLIVEYAKQNTECHQLWTQLQEVTLAQKENKASEMKDRRKEMQRKAMQKMMQQQSAFALSMDDDMDEDDQDDLDFEESKDSNMDESEESQISKFMVPPLTCHICSEEGTTDMVYVGFIQPSKIVAQRDEISRERTSDGASLHVQLCGHALHFKCCSDYIKSKKKQEMRAQHPDYTVLSAKGEFSCPLCKTLSNTMIPHIPYLSTVQVLENMEHVFIASQSPDAIVQWLKDPHLFESTDRSTAQHQVKRHFEPEVAQSFERFENQEAQYREPIKGVGELVPSFRVAVLSGNDRLMVLGNTLWSMIADTVRNLEHARMSMAMLEYHYRSRPANSGASVPSDLNLLGLDLSSDQESLLDGISARDEIHLSLVLKLASQLDTCQKRFRASYDEVVLTPLRLMLQQRETTFDQNKNTNHYPYYPLSEPLLGTDLLYTLVVLLTSSSCLSEALMAIRTLCIAQVTQVLLRSTVMDGLDSVVYTEEQEKMEEQDIAHILQLREQVLAFCGAEKLQDVVKHPRLLVRMIQTNVCQFCRQAVILCRVLFRGAGANASEYSTFVSSLRVSSNVEEMCQALGVPTIVQLAQSPTLVSQMQHWAAQLGRDPSSLNTATARCRPLPVPFHHLLLQPSTSNKLMYSTTTFPESLTPNTRFPNQYIDLYNRMSTFKCPETDKLSSKNAAICLVCGTVVCAIASCCRVEAAHDNATSSHHRDTSVGACSSHTDECGAGVGVFFMVQHSIVLFVFQSRNVYFRSLYVDSHGEDDEYLRRGRELFFNPQRLASILELYVMHQIPAEVIRIRSNPGPHQRLFYPNSH